MRSSEALQVYGTSHKGKPHSDISYNTCSLFSRPLSIPFDHVYPCVPTTPFVSPIDLALELTTVTAIAVEPGPTITVPTQLRTEDNVGRVGLGQAGLSDTSDEQSFRGIMG